MLLQISLNSEQWNRRPNASQWLLLALIVTATRWCGVLEPCLDTIGRSPWTWPKVDPLSMVGQGMPCGLNKLDLYTYRAETHRSSVMSALGVQSILLSTEFGSLITAWRGSVRL